MKIHVNAPSCKQLTTLLAIAGVTTFTSCQKESSGDEEAITTQEVADVMSESVTPESGGVVAQVESSSQISAIPFYLAACGVAKDSTVANAGTKGLHEWSFSFNWHWLLTCSNGDPQKFQVTVSGNSDYNGPRLTSTHSSNGSLTIEGLQLASTKYAVNETFVRTGAHVSKVGRKLTFTTETAVNLADVMVDKLTKKIVSGIAELTVKGTNSAGKTFTYQGTLTFNGNSRATLVLKNGQSFLLQW